MFSASLTLKASRHLRPTHRFSWTFLLLCLIGMLSPLSAEMKMEERRERELSSSESNCTTDLVPNDSWALDLGVQSGHDLGRALAADSMGNVVFAGETNLGALNGVDIFVGQVTRNGQYNWGKVIRGLGTEAAHAVAINSNTNDIFVVGYTDSEIGLLKTIVSCLDSKGAQKWSNTYAVGANNAGYAADFSKGYLYIAGQSQNAVGLYAITVSKLSGNDGSPVWTQSFMTTRGNSKAFALKIDQKGDVVVSGQTIVGAGDYDYYGPINGGSGDADVVVFKLNAIDGSRIWTQQIGQNTYADTSYTLGITAENKIIIGGQTFGSQATGNDMLFARLSSGGSLESVYAMGGHSFEFLRGLIINGKSVLGVGSTSSFETAYLHRVLFNATEEGALQHLHSHHITGHLANFDHNYAIASVPTGDYVILGHTSAGGYTAEFNIFVAKPNAQYDIPSLSRNFRSISYPISTFITTNLTGIITPRSSNFTVNATLAIATPTRMLQMTPAPPGYAHDLSLVAVDRPNLLPPTTANYLMNMSLNAQSLVFLNNPNVTLNVSILQPVPSFLNVTVKGKTQLQAIGRPGRTTSLGPYSIRLNFSYIGGSQWGGLVVGELDLQGCVRAPTPGMLNPFQTVPHGKSYTLDCNLPGTSPELTSTLPPGLSFINGTISGESIALGNMLFPVRLQNKALDGTVVRDVLIELRTGPETAPYPFGSQTYHATAARSVKLAVRSGDAEDSSLVFTPAPPFISASHIDPSSGAVFFSSPPPGTYVLGITANDGTLQTTWSVTVVIETAPGPILFPSQTQTTVSLSSLFPGRNITVSRIPGGGSYSVQTGLLTWTAPYNIRGIIPGNIEVNVTNTDGSSDGVQIGTNTVNTAPVVTPHTYEVFAGDRAGSVTADVSGQVYDAEDPLSSLVFGQGQGSSATDASISPTGTAELMPALGSRAVNVTAADPFNGNGWGMQQFNGRAVPRLTLAFDQPVQLNLRILFGLPTATFSNIILPVGLSVDPVTYDVTGNPKALGNQALTATVHHDNTVQTATVQALVPNTAPTVAGQSVTTIQGSETRVDAPPTEDKEAKVQGPPRFDLALMNGQAPASEVSINGATGAVSISPVRQTRYNLNVTATDIVGATGWGVTSVTAVAAPEEIEAPFGRTTATNLRDVLHLQGVSAEIAMTPVQPGQTYNPTTEIVISTPGGSTRNFYSAPVTATFPHAQANLSVVTNTPNTHPVVTPHTYEVFAGAGASSVTADVSGQVHDAEDPLSSLAFGQGQGSSATDASISPTGTAELMPALGSRAVNVTAADPFNGIGWGMQQFNGRAVPRLTLAFDQPVQLNLRTLLGLPDAEFSNIILPAGLSVDPVSYDVSGSPEVVGANQVLTATIHNDNTVQTVTVQALVPNTAPTVAGQSVTTIQGSETRVGAPPTEDKEAKVQGSPRFGLAPMNGQAPASEVSINGTTGAVSISPVRQAYYDLNVTATDSEGAMGWGVTSVTAVAAPEEIEAPFGVETETNLRDVLHLQGVPAQIEMTPTQPGQAYDSATEIVTSMPEGRTRNRYPAEVSVTFPHAQANLTVVTHTANTDPVVLAHMDQVFGGEGAGPVTADVSSRIHDQEDPFSQLVLGEGEHSSAEAATVLSSGKVTLNPPLLGSTVAVNVTATDPFNGVGWGMQQFEGQPLPRLTFTFGESIEGLNLRDLLGNATSFAVLETPAGISIDPVTYEFSGSSTLVGNGQRLSVVVETEDTTQTVTIFADTPNTAPRYTGPTEFEAYEGTGILDLSSVSSDAETPLADLIYTAEGASPAEIQAAGPARFSYNPSAPEVSFRYGITDPQGNSTSTQLTIRFRRAPVAPFTVTRYSSYSLSVLLSNVDSVTVIERQPWQTATDAALFGVPPVTVRGPASAVLGFRAGLIVGQTSVSTPVHSIAPWIQVNGLQCFVDITPCLATATVHSIDPAALTVAGPPNSVAAFGSSTLSPDGRTLSIPLNPRGVGTVSLTWTATLPYPNQADYGPVSSTNTSLVTIGSSLTATASNGTRVVAQGSSFSLWLSAQSLRQNAFIYVRISIVPPKAATLSTRDRGAVSLAYSSATGIGTTSQGPPSDVAAVGSATVHLDPRYYASNVSITLSVIDTGNSPTVTTHLTVFETPVLFVPDCSALTETLPPSFEIPAGQWASYSVAEVCVDPNPPYRNAGAGMSYTVSFDAGVEVQGQTATLHTTVDQAGLIFLGQVFVSNGQSGAEARNTTIPLAFAVTSARPVSVQTVYQAVDTPVVLPSGALPAGFNPPTGAILNADGSTTQQAPGISLTFDSRALRFTVNARQGAAVDQTLVVQAPYASGLLLTVPVPITRVPSIGLDILETSPLYIEEQYQALTLHPYSLDGFGRRIPTHSDGTAITVVVSFNDKTVQISAPPPASQIGQRPQITAGDTGADPNIYASGPIKEIAPVLALKWRTGPLHFGEIETSISYGNSDHDPKTVSLYQAGKHVWHPLQANPIYPKPYLFPACQAKTSCTLSIPKDLASCIDTALPSLGVEITYALSHRVASYLSSFEALGSGTYAVVPTEDASVCPFIITAYSTNGDHLDFNASLPVTPAAPLPDKSSVLPSVSPAFVAGAGGILAIIWIIRTCLRKNRLTKQTQAELRRQDAMIASRKNDATIVIEPDAESKKQALYAALDELEAEDPPRSLKEIPLVEYLRTLEKIRTSPDFVREFESIQGRLNTLIERRISAIGTLPGLDTPTLPPETAKKLGDAISEIALGAQYYANLNPKRNLLRNIQMLPMFLKIKANLKEHFNTFTLVGPALPVLAKALHDLCSCLLICHSIMNQGLITATIKYDSLKEITDFIKQVRDDLDRGEVSQDPKAYEQAIQGLLFLEMTRAAILCTRDNAPSNLRLFCHFLTNIGNFPELKVVYNKLKMLTPKGWYLQLLWIHRLKELLPIDRDRAISEILKEFEHTKDWQVFYATLLLLVDLFKECSDEVTRMLILDQLEKSAHGHDLVNSDKSKFANRIWAIQTVKENVRQLGAFIKKESSKVTSLVRERFDAVAVSLSSAASRSVVYAESTVTSAHSPVKPSSPRTALSISPITARTAGILAARREYRGSLGGRASLLSESFRAQLQRKSERPEATALAWKTNPMRRASSASPADMKSIPERASIGRTATLQWQRNPLQTSRDSLTKD